MIRVLIVDDHELLPAGLRSRLERQDGIAIVGEAEPATSSPTSAHSLTPPTAHRHSSPLRAGARHRPADHPGYTNQEIG
jgi:hypothetical protein